MAISSYNTKLMIGTKTYAIKDFPAILGERSALEITTLSDDAQRYIQGIRQQSESFPFLANYDATIYQELNALSGEQESFDGSANKSIAVTLANSGVTAGTYSAVTVDAKPKSHRTERKPRPP